MRDVEGVDGVHHLEVAVEDFVSRVDDRHPHDPGDVPDRATKQEDDVEVVDVPRESRHPVGGQQREAGLRQPPGPVVEVEVPGGGERLTAVIGRQAVHHEGTAGGDSDRADDRAPDAPKQVDGVHVLRAVEVPVDIGAEHREASDVDPDQQRPRAEAVTPVVRPDNGDDENKARLADHALDRDGRDGGGGDLPAKEVVAVREAVLVPEGVVMRLVSRWLWS